MYDFDNESNSDVNNGNDRGGVVLRDKDTQDRRLAIEDGVVFVLRLK